MKLLHHSDISSTPNSMMICSFCVHSNYSLNGCCSSHATHLWGVWYSLLPTMTCNKNVTSKQPMPEHIFKFIMNSVGFLFSAWNKVVYFVYIFISDHWIRIQIFVCIGILFHSLFSDLLVIISAGLFVLHFTLKMSNIFISDIHVKLALSSGNAKNLPSFCLILCLIVMLHTPNWGMLVLLYVPKITLLFLFFF